MFKFLSFFSILASFCFLCNGHQIHRYMSAQEIRQVFHAAGLNVPEYDIVEMKHKALDGQGEDISYFRPEVQISGRNKDLQLYLEPTEGYLADEYTPLWTVRSNVSARFGLEYTRVRNPFVTMIGNFHDISKRAALTVEKDEDGNLIFDGIVDNSLVIRPLPKRVLTDVMYGGENLYEPLHLNNGTNDTVYTYHHVMYRMPKSQEMRESYIRFKKAENSGKFAKRKTPLPDVIFPKVLVVVDFNEYSLIGKNLEHAKRYILAFWNGVDLRYRMLTNPRIRFNLAGIIIALDNGAVPYVHQNRIGYALVDADKALRNMSTYFYRETRFPYNTYDFVITLTQLDLCNYNDGICDPSTLGYAFVAGACNRDHDRKLSEATGIVEDNGGYSGIIPAAHEIGHLIGAHHDGSHESSKKCPSEDGYIMTSDLGLHENGFQWSPCTIDSFNTFLNQERASCLPIPPRKMGRKLKIALPGKMKTLDEQCQKVFGTSSQTCFRRNPDICTRLECSVPGGAFCRAIAPAAEGSPCGKNMFCLNGRCVPEGYITKLQDPVRVQNFNMIYQRIGPVRM
ncbi:A disintegrin and metalloproteinase with thrombospondin motifs like [Prorops nasuta]|uniref:A disintegrin and metalloproteinase with thrombospondin motifs like n=1 Tax=Prorops nasuta TaxID=863751 RepID=UPI0034CEE2FE